MTVLTLESSFPRRRESTSAEASGERLHKRESIGLNRTRNTDRRHSRRIRAPRLRTINIAEDIATKTFEPESFDSLLDDLTKEIEVRNYRVTRVYDIDNIFQQAEREIGYSIPFERYKIVEFCNLGSCAELISQEMLAGVFMPLRFIVYQETGTGLASIAFLKPSAFARPFGSAPLAATAASLEGDMTEVLDELAF